MATEPQQQNKVMASISATVEKIKVEQASDVRTKLAQQLSELIKGEDTTAIDTKLINEISDLLRDKDDSVRYWAATSLGYIGPRAGFTIPALEKALKEKDDDLSSKSSASAIRLALERIRRKPAGSN
ncbi:MAG: HEAT repeat domain-containing protein [Lacunisphaera sp.]